MFAILGVFLFKNKLGYCSSIKDYHGINKETCLANNWTWEIFPQNFEHIGQGLSTLFILSSLEGWPAIFYSCYDGQPEDIGPIQGSNLPGLFYILFFIVIGAFFFMNLFIGVIFDEFYKEQKNQNKQLFSLSKNQIQWIEMQSLIVNANPH